MKTAFMITNRNRTDTGPGTKLAGSLSYFMAPIGKSLDQWSSWTPTTQSELEKELMAETAAFPVLTPEENFQESHLSLFVHGYNNTWDGAARRYQKLIESMYSGASSLGVLVFLTWPSNGQVTSYPADREDARESAPLIADLLVRLHDHVRKMQLVAERTSDPAKLCKAKVSVIAHSMGNYVMQKALAMTSKRLNNPSLITLIHQLVMVASDVDNDLFQKDQPEGSDGNLMANLCYRITAPYSGYDDVLGASAGLKHFGTRRLGRSGLKDRDNVHDNVWDIDVSEKIKGHKNPHSALFETEEGIAFLTQVLRGVDRKLIAAP